VITDETLKVLKEDIKKRLPKEFNCEDFNERTLIVTTPLKLSDGSLIQVYVTPKADNISSNHVEVCFEISDFAETVRTLKSLDLMVSPEKIISRLRGFEYSNGEIKITVTKAEELPNAIIWLAKTIQQILNHFLGDRKGDKNA